MCGIAGILAFEEEPDIVVRLAGMLSAMRHRGPDDEGLTIFHRTDRGVDMFGGEDTPAEVFASGTSYAPRKVRPRHDVSNVLLALGHRRLSILDLSAAGHQPMGTGDGRYWIVYNGEVYNYREIRSELERDGETFSSNTDTEVILKAYRKWGPDSLARFNGMFAFAIWDNREKQLFCARDRIGIKPFYFMRSDRLFLFASDIKTIIASGLYRPDVDLEGLYHALSFNCAPRPLTCFKGVRSLQQAHWMRVNHQGSLTQRRYWSVPSQDTRARKAEDWYAELDAQLKTSVKQRLIADVPVGTFMSGGIDSTTVSALASGLQPGIQAFTLGFGVEGEHLNEVAEATATAQMHPMRHVLKIVDAAETLEYLEDMVLCLEEPSSSPAPNYIISKFVREHNVTVVLNGLGGDELFCGYGREKLGRQWKRLRPWHSLLGMIPPLTQSLEKRQRISSLRDLVDCYVYHFSIFSDHEKQPLFRGLLPELNSFDFFRELYLAGRELHDPVETVCLCDLLNYVGNHHVYRVDQFTMWFSLESRFPLLDHELVELAFRMPSELKVAHGKSKYILRQVARNYIAPACLDMRKKGFSLPVGAWIEGPLRSFVADKISRLKKRELFSPQAIDWTVTEYQTRRRSYLQLWMLVSVEMWLERFIDNHRRLRTDLIGSDHGSAEGHGI